VNATSGNCALGVGQGMLGGLNDPLQAHGQGMVAIAEFNYVPSEYVPYPAANTVRFGLTGGSGIGNDELQYEFSVDVNSNPPAVGGLPLTLYYLTAPTTNILYQQGIPTSGSPESVVYTGPIPIRH